MTATEFEQWVATARAQTRQRMAAAQQQFGLGQHARYEMDLPSASIRFYNAEGLEQVRATLQVAGSWSPASESWLWGWQNDSVPGLARSRMQAVRERGEQGQLDVLTGAVQGCDEGQAWTLASLAAHILDAPCVYRAPGPKNMLFVLLFDIARVN